MADSPAEQSGAQPAGEEPDERECSLDANEGEFTLVDGRPFKRPRVGSAEDQQQHTANPLRFIIRPILSGKSLTKISPIRISKEINEACGPLKSMSKSGTSLAAVCFNSKQAKQLQCLDVLCGVNVKVTESIPQTKGVITGIDLEITDDELIEELGVQVTQIKRITRRVGGEVSPTTAVILWFKSNKLPFQVNIGYEIKRVSEYRPPVARCFNCQRFGHSALRCNSKTKCPRCSLNHKWEQCPNKKETPKCANCGGEHSTAYLGCSKYKTAKDIQTITHTEKLSFAEATKRYINNNKNAAPNPKPIPQLVIPPAAGTLDQHPNHAKHQSQRQQQNPQHQQQQQQQQQQQYQQQQHQQQQQQQQQQTQQPSQEDNDMDISTPIAQLKSIETQTEIQSADLTPFLINEKVLAFLAFIINNLTESPTKSSRIQLVVDAARICCNVAIPTSKVLEILTNE